MAKLVVNYWTPEMTPEQARWRYQTFFEDLAGCSEPELRHACGEYRRNVENKFFPTSAQLLDIITKRRLAERPFAARGDLPKESRPNLWWLLPIWKPHWRESEIPIEEVRRFEARKRVKGEPRVMP